MVITLRNTFLKNKGMSLVEVMIVLVIMSLIGLGTTTLLTNTLSIQKNADTKSHLTTFRKNLESFITNDTAWTNTVYAASNSSLLACLRDGSAGCANGTVVQNFDIYNASNGSPAVFYQGTSASAGIDLLGKTCTTFSTSSGDDDCPFHYDVQMTMTCPGTLDPCPKPQLHVEADLVVNPASVGDRRFQVNTGLYKIDIQRGERVRYETISLRHFNNGGGPGSGGGECGAGGPGPSDEVVRDLTLTTAEIKDIGQNIISSDDTADEFVLQPGTYECTVTAQGYSQPSGFKIILQDRTTPLDHIIGSGFSALGNSTIVTGKVRFQINNPAGHTFRVIHQCGLPGGPPPYPGQSPFNLGIPSAPYGGGNSFTQVFCVRTS